MNRLFVALGASCGFAFFAPTLATGQELASKFYPVDSQTGVFTQQSIQLEQIPQLDLSSDLRPSNALENRSQGLAVRSGEAGGFLAVADDNKSAPASPEISPLGSVFDDVLADDQANGAPTEASRRLIPADSGDTTTPSHRPIESDTPADQAERSHSPKLVLSPETEQRLLKAHRVLDVYRPKLLNTRQHGPWETMHAIVAYGVESQIRRDGPTGEPVTAIGWLSYNNPAAGQRLFYARREGGLGALTGPGLQGHSGQFLAIMAQSRLDRTYPILAEGKKFTLEDLIKFEQDTCQPNSELTFKLISLAHYLDSDATWKNENGQDWNIQRLIREELAQPINGVACGGTHRLFGLSYAVFQRARQGKPMIGEFARAKKFISDYHNYTFALQNPDGSFSTNWFKGREARNDLDRRLQTTGHILEWMVFSMPRENLQDPRIGKAVDYLADIMLENSTHSWPIGPRGHALHAMAIYEMRLAPAKGEGVLPVANRFDITSPPEPPAVQRLDSASTTTTQSTSAAP